MKQKANLRLLSLVLSLVMLLPLISIPTFAEDAIYASTSESFDGKTRADVLSSGPLTATVTAAAKDAATHGDVLRLDAFPKMAYDYYMTNGSAKDPFKDGYTLETATDGTLKISGTTVGGITVTKAPVAVTWGAKQNYGDTGYAAVTGAVIDARLGGGNVMAPAQIKHGALSADGDFIVAEMDVYLSEDLALSQGITGRIYTNQSNKRAELFKIGKSSVSGYVTFEKHGDAGTFKSQNGTKLLALGEWHTLTFLINRTTTVLTAYADGEYVFQSISNHTNGTGIYSLVGNEALPLTVKENTLQVEFTRLNGDPSVMKGYIQIDNASVTLRDVSNLSFAHDFEGATLSTDTTTQMSLATVTKADVDAETHGDVVRIRTEPDASVAYYLWTDRNNKWPITGTVTDGKLTGTCSKGTITDAAIPTDDADTSKTCTVGGTTYKIVTGNYADMTAGMENYMQPLRFKQPYMEFGGDFYTVSFDLYLSADFKSSGSNGFTGRMLVDGVDGAETRIQLFQLYSDGETNEVFMRRHGDANATNGVPAHLRREQWYRIDIVIDRNTTRQYVLVDGAFAFETMSNKDGQKPTSALIGTTAIPMVARANELQFENARGTNAANVGGYVQLDNVTTTVGDAPAFAYDFDLLDVGSTAHGTVTQSTSTEISGSSIQNNRGSNAWCIPVTGNDRSQYLCYPELSYETGETFVYEVDYFIEADATGQIQQQFQQLTANVGGTRVTKNWLDLYQLQFANGTVTFKFENSVTCEGFNFKTHTYQMSAGRWHTVSLVLDLKDGYYDVYVDGNLIFDNVPLYRAAKLSEIIVDAAKITVGKTNKVTGSGSFQIDNVRVFKGTKPTAEPEVDLGVNTFDVYRYSVGKNIGMQRLPSLATIETVGESNAALRIDMAPAEFDGDYVLLQASGDGAATKTLGTTFEWNLADKTQGTLDGEAITLVQNGEFYEYVQDEITYRVVSAAVAGASIGGRNVCVPTKSTHGVFSYTTEKKVVLEADYLIEEGSTGIIENQIEKFYYGGEEMTEASYMNVYNIKMDTGRLDMGLYLDVGEWNNVKAILDLETGLIDIYVNGVFSHQKKQAKAEYVDITFGGDLNHSWSVAKVYRQVNLNSVPYHGGLLIDNISLSTELPETSETFGEKFLSDEAFYTFATNSLMEIQDGASIRMKADGTGLRFATRMNDLALKNLIALRLDAASVTFGRRGTLVSTKAYYDAVDSFTHENLEQLPVSGAKYLDIAFDGFFFGGGAGVNLPKGDYMVGSVVNLKSYTREFAAAGYVELIVDGTAYFLYTDVVVRSAAEVATRALEDTTVEWTDDQKNILETFAGIR